MDIQFVLTESAPVFEFAIPAERIFLQPEKTVILLTLLAIDANSEAEPPVAAVDAIPANTVKLQYAMPAATDAARVAH